MPVTQHDPIPKNDLEEAAQGQDLFRSPGADLHVEEARDQAEASGWLPPDAVYDWPSTDLRRQVVNRRQLLYDAMQRLETSVARASGLEDWAEQVTKALASLGAALKRHIEEIEAPDGLFPEVIDMAPHLVSSIERLRREHEDLSTGCQAALDMVNEGVPASEVRRRVLAILGRLAIHRQRGAELLFDAYNVELTAAN